MYGYRALSPFGRSVHKTRINNTRYGSRKTNAAGTPRGLTYKIMRSVTKFRQRRRRIAIKSRRCTRLIIIVSTLRPRPRWCSIQTFSPRATCLSPTAAGPARGRQDSARQDRRVVLHKQYNGTGCLPNELRIHGFPARPYILPPLTSRYASVCAAAAVHVYCYTRVLAGAAIAGMSLVGFKYLPNVTEHRAPFRTRKPVHEQQTAITIHILLFSSIV